MPQQAWVRGQGVSFPIGDVFRVCDDILSFAQLGAAASIPTGSWGRGRGPPGCFVVTPPDERDRLPYLVRARVPSVLLQGRDPRVSQGEAIPWERRSRVSGEMRSRERGDLRVMGGGDPVSRGGSDPVPSNIYKVAPANTAGRDGLLPLVMGSDPNGDTGVATDSPTMADSLMTARSAEFGPGCHQQCVAAWLT